ncbi:MAG: hypothetical protein OEX76_00075 [Candidatus Bathyarchaeota archaeon]|nr:hypothetical protein [Candidatus Bathyarchaeota archaeon]MDH5531847.1 hypothetical protein [Candidatus Bathyarchaeota archaeon]MDH5712369.1 hypothetical protein [Candidatus Bathyarchaeota archaeon]
MKEKALILFTCVIIAMSISGFVYAQWNDIIVVDCTMEFGDLNMGFVEPLICTEYYTDPVTGQLFPGEYLNKDVGKPECNYTDHVTDIDTGKQGYKTLTITITNAYPSYKVHCNFTLENLGTLKLHINETEISDPDGVLTWDPNLKALVDAGGKPILNITITPDLVCKYLWANDDPLTPDVEPVKLQAEIAVHITQNAQECQTYFFQVKITYEVA